MKSTVYSTFDSLHAQFKNPTLLMKKRDAKALDFNRVKEARARGDPVDRALAESADVYTSMNAQLVEELPKFLSLVESLVDIIVIRIATVQAETYYDLYTIMNILPPGSVVDGLQEVLDYQQSMAIVGTLESAFKGLGILYKWRRSIWGDQTTISEGEYLQGFLLPMDHYLLISRISHHPMPCPGFIHLTDMDTIEKKNLNRRSLF